MTTWTHDELAAIGNAEELEIQSLRADGSLRTRVTIWVARVGNDLYVRAYKGRSSPWFRGAQTQHAGRIHAGGVDKDVRLIETGDDEALNDQVDAAFRAKYARYYDIVGDMVTPQARAATLRLVQS